VKAEKTRPKAEAAQEMAAREGAAKEEASGAGEAAERQKAAAQKAAAQKAAAQKAAAQKAAAQKAAREAAVEQPPTAEDEEPVVEELQEERAAARGAREGGDKAAPRHAVSGPTRDFSVSLQQQAHASDDHAKFYMVVGGAVAFSAVVIQHGLSTPLAVPKVGSLCLLRARLAALAGSALPGERPAHWAPATASGVRASRLRNRRFHCLRPSR
jgi:hypothetical protein